MHMMFKKNCMLLYKKTEKKIKSIFGYDLKLLSFLKMKHIIYKELTHIQISYLFKNRKKKPCHLPKQSYAFS
jgi:hypothetical protein